MTDTTPEPGCGARPVNAAPLQPCQECPWRRSNVGRPAPEPYEDSYTRDHHVRCWSDVADGQLSGCHLTAPGDLFPMGSDPRWVEGGYKAVPNHAQPRECAGSVVAALREVRRVIQAGSIERYVKENPQGMSAEAAGKWLRRIQGRQVEHWPELRQPAIDEADIIDPAQEYDIDFTELLGPNRDRALTDLIEATLKQIRQEERGA